MAAVGAAVQGVIEGAAVDLLGTEGGALVLGVAGLAADLALVLARERGVLQRLDDVGGGGFEVEESVRWAANCSWRTRTGSGSGAGGGCRGSNCRWRRSGVAQ